MKNNLALCLAAIWFPVAMAIIAGLYFTKDMRCLWFLLIPSLISVKTSDNKEVKDE